MKYFLVAGLNNILHPICSAYLQYLYIPNIIFPDIIDKFQILIFAHFFIFVHYSSCKFHEEMQQIGICCYSFRLL